MAKINGNLPWVLALAISLLGWVYTLGTQSNSLQNIKDNLIKLDTVKANKDVIKVQLDNINYKLNILLDCAKEQKKVK